MFHARIAARAFNTPLLVEPSKAMAFLSGLGPRVLGRRVEMASDDLSDAFGADALPAPRPTADAYGERSGRDAQAAAEGCGRGRIIQPERVNEATFEVNRGLHNRAI